MHGVPCEYVSHFPVLGPGRTSGLKYTKEKVKITKETRTIRVKMRMKMKMKETKTETKMKVERQMKTEGNNSKTSHRTCREME